MKLPGTLDLRRRRSGRGSASSADGDLDGDLDDEYEYEYVEIDDADGTEIGDGWEWIEVDDDPPVDPGAAAGRPRRRRARGLAGFLVGRLPLDDQVSEGAGVDDDDGWPVEAVEDADRDDDGGWDDDRPVPVDPRIAARRDEVSHARRARRSRRLIVLGIVVGVLVGLALLTRSPLLDVDEVVVSGAVLADPAELAAATGITPGTPLLGLDLAHAGELVRAQPWVLDASVDKTWSGTVTVTVVEREPVATINAGDGGWLLIDADGRVVASKADPPALPIIDGVGVAAVGAELGADAQAAIDVARSLTPALRTRVMIVHGADPNAIELALQPSGTVRFGPATKLDERVRSLQTMFARVDLVCVDTIDLRVPGSAVLKRIPGCA